MGKIIIVGLSLLLLTGCETFKRKERIVTVEVKVPVFACPAEAANMTIPSRPLLLKDTLSEADRNNPGRVSQAYLVDIQSLIVYSQSLEFNAKALDTLCKNSDVE